MKKAQMYVVTEFGAQYTKTKARTVKGLVKAFENVIGDIYEVNDQEYYGYELPYRMRLKLLELDGFIEQK